MSETTIGSEIYGTPIKSLVYLYDFNKNWSFLVELINVSKEENPRLTYPSVGKVEGIAPSQYGTKGLLGEKFADVEEKYDLTQAGRRDSVKKNEEGEDLGLAEEGGGARRRKLSLRPEGRPVMLLLHNEQIPSKDSHHRNRAYGIGERLLWLSILHGDIKRRSSLRIAGNASGS